MKQLFLLLTVFSLAFAQDVQTDKGSYQNITVTELKEKLMQEGQFFFVNTHIPYEGEIEGTDAFIPFDQLETYYPVLPKDKTSEIVLYCMSGRMSEIASETLVSMGYTNIKNVVGGMRAWSQAGLEIKDAFADMSDSGKPNLDAVSAKVGIPRSRFVTADISGDAALGQEGAQLVLVEYSDVNCPYCAKFHVETLPILKARFIDTGQLSYVYRDYISVGGALSQAAAETAECLKEQVGDTRYLELISALYAVEGRKNAERLLDLAVNDSYDSLSLESCVSEGRYKNEIAQDQLAGQQAGIRGTPGFILGYQNEAGLVEGMVFQGALPIDTFDQYVRAFLEANN